MSRRWQTEEMSHEQVVSDNRRADVVRAVSLSDEQMVEVAFGCVEAAGRQELRTCHYTPIGQPCTFSDLLSAVAGSIVRVRAELAAPPAVLVMTRRAILNRASDARRRRARAQEART